MSQSIPFIRIWLMSIILLLLHGCGGMAVQPVGDDFDAALALLKDKKYEQAVTAFHKVIAKNNRLAAAHVNLGIAYTELGKRDEAKKALLSAIEISPSNAIAYNQLGIVYRQTGEFKKAKEAYEKSIAKQSGYTKAYLNLGILCDLYLRDSGCAIKNYEKYQTMTKREDKQVELWIQDLRTRTQ